MKKGTLIVIGFSILLIAALIWTTLGNQQYRCEVCISYNGLTKCRTASARTKETAQRTAADMACAEMAGNMAERINCPNTPPNSVTWK